MKTVKEIDPAGHGIYLKARRMIRKMLVTRNKAGQVYISPTFRMDKSDKGPMRFRLYEVYFILCELGAERGKYLNYWRVRRPDGSPLFEPLLTGPLGECRVDATKHGHRFAEAFCLMKYQSEDGSEVEWLWNSRDGETSNHITSRSGKPMTHVQWDYDIYAPQYKPLAGERIFVTRPAPAPDSPEALAAGRLVDAQWDKGGALAMRHRFPDKEAGAQALLTPSPLTFQIEEVRPEPSPENA